MAVESDNSGEIKAHVKSYALFSSMMKWGTVLSFIIAMLVIVIISS